MAIVQRANSKAFEKIILKVRQLEGIETKVGWFENSKYPDGTPVAYVAAIQELGSVANKIPPRPAVRDAIAHDSQKWAKTVEDGTRAILKGNATGVEVMEALGVQAQGSIQDSISTLTTPALSPLTIGLRAYKKKFPNAKITAATLGIVARMLKEGTLDVSGTSTKPLNDTGLMLATVASKTEKSD